MRHVTIVTLLLASLAACGGRTIGSEDGGVDAEHADDARPSAETGAPDGGDCTSIPCAQDSGEPIPDAGPPGCPSSPPSEESPCANTGLYCEYGSDPDPYCNLLFQCQATEGASTPIWARFTYHAACPPAGSCLPSYAAASGDRGMCPDDGAICPYPQGTCLCTMDPGGLPAVNGPLWDCHPVTPGCPTSRPTLGTPCESSPTVCDYGGCSGGVDEQCVDGDWAIAMTGCPA